MPPLLHVLLWPLALFGLVALAFVVAIAQPLTPPPPLASIHAGADADFARRVAGAHAVSGA